MAAAAAAQNRSTRVFAFCNMKSETHSNRLVFTAPRFAPLMKHHLTPDFDFFLIIIIIFHSDMYSESQQPAKHTLFKCFQRLIAGLFFFMYCNNKNNNRKISPRDSSWRCKQDEQQFSECTAETWRPLQQLFVPRAVSLQYFKCMETTAEETLSPSERHLRRQMISDNNLGGALSSFCPRR